MIYNLANQSLGELSKKEKAEMLSDVEKAVANLLHALRIDYENDHNCKDTPKRVAKMYCEELFVGRYSNKPKMTMFENVEKYDTLITAGPIEVHSTCSHHLAQFAGHAFVGILPKHDSKLPGLSKYNRIVEWISKRPQIQEELTTAIASFIYNETNAAGVAVRIVSSHSCTTTRGVKHPNSKMVTTKLLGEFLKHNHLKQEFLQECSNLEKSN